MHCDGKLCFKIGEEENSFRALSTSDVNQEYVDTLKNDIGFIENANVTLSSQRSYVDEIRSSPSQILCGLFRNGVLAGTSGIQINNNVATIGILVFDNYRGLGLGTTLVWSASVFAAELLSVTTLAAGAKANNVPSLKSFTRCGFTKIYNSDMCQFSADYQDVVRPNFIVDCKVVDK